MQVSRRRCKLVMNASVFFFFLYSQTRMWFVYVCDTVWPVTAVSLPGFLLFFFVFFLLLFLSKIETMRHCRPPSHISVCSALDRARDSAALKLPLLSRLPAYFPSVRLDFVFLVILWAAGVFRTTEFCQLICVHEITARMCQTFCLSEKKHKKQKRCLALFSSVLTVDLLKRPFTTYRSGI